MDAAAAFLHRKERDALARKRKGEPMRALVPVVHDDRTGLLAITPARILHAARQRLRTPVRQWARRTHPLHLERRGYGILHVGKLRFELMSRDDADAVQRALDPVGRAGAARASAPRPTRAPAPVRIDRPPADPLAHRGTVEHEARLRQLHAKGMLTKAELEWHLAR